MSPDTPSMVTTSRPCSTAAGVTHARAARPSMCTGPGPHWAMPQPYLVPVISTCSRSTKSSGMSSSAATVRAAPLIRRLAIGSSRRSGDRAPDLGEPREGGEDLRVVRREVAHDDVREAQLAELAESRGHLRDTASHQRLGVEAAIARRPRRLERRLRLGLGFAHVHVATDRGRAGRPAVRLATLAVIRELLARDVEH